MAHQHALLLFVTLLLCCICNATDIAKVSQSQEAYATLLYGDPYVLGVRVLGQSLRDSGTSKDMIALVTGPVSASSEMTLMMDGWKVKRVSPVRNPGKGPQPTGSPHRFWAVYTKLLIFQLVEYKKVIFLDADILVIKNMDVLFGCPGFCAALRHSERFNSGVMALVPSEEVYEDMIGHIDVMASYTGGDQGFLNAYFQGFADSPLFDPAVSYGPDELAYMRLPTIFNADVGLYIVNANRWMIPRETLHCIHFTLGALKPWVWYTSWLIGETDTWQAYRHHLPADSNGIQHGRTPRQAFAETWLLLLPPAMLGIVLWRWHLQARHQYRTMSSLERNHHGKGNHNINGAGLGTLLPALSAETELKTPRGSFVRSTTSGSGGLGGGILGLFTVANAAAVLKACLPRASVLAALGAGYTSILVAVGCTLLIVPPEVAPIYGWVLSYEWGLLIFAACYGSFLLLCLRWGRQATSYQDDPHHDHKLVPKPWTETALAGVTFLAYVLLVPWTGTLLGVQAPITRVLVTVAIAVVGNLGLTVHFLSLPMLWFRAGRGEWVRHIE